MTANYGPHWRILMRSDGFSKRDWVTAWKPEYIFAEYRNPGLGNYTGDNFLTTSPTTWKTYFKFKEWLQPDLALYEEIS